MEVLLLLLVVVLFAVFGVNKQSSTITVDRSLGECYSNTKKLKESPIQTVKKKKTNKVTFHSEVNKRTINKKGTIKDTVIPINNNADA